MPYPARATLEDQLSRLGVGTGRKRRSSKGTRIAPKYRGPKGETWAGRGARPRWLVALLRQGHRIEEFAVDRVVPAQRRKTAGKGGTKKSSPTRKSRSPSNRSADRGQADLPAIIAK